MGFYLLILMSPNSAFGGLCLSVDSIMGTRTVGTGAGARHPLLCRTNTITVLWVRVYA